MSILGNMRSAFRASGMFGRQQPITIDEDVRNTLREEAVVGVQFERMIQMEGWKNLEKRMNERLEKLRRMLVYAKQEDVPRLQAQAIELQEVMMIVPQSIICGENAHAALVELESKDNGN